MKMCKLRTFFFKRLFEGEGSVLNVQGHNPKFVYQVFIETVESLNLS